MHTGQFPAGHQKKRATNGLSARTGIASNVVYCAAHAAPTAMSSAHATTRASGGGGRAPTAAASTKPPARERHPCRASEPRETDSVVTQPYSAKQSHTTGDSLTTPDSEATTRQYMNRRGTCARLDSPQTRTDIAVTTAPIATPVTQPPGPVTSSVARDPATQLQAPACCSACSATTAPAAAVKGAAGEKPEAPPR